MDIAGIISIAILAVIIVAMIDDKKNNKKDDGSKWEDYFNN